MDVYEALYTTRAMRRVQPDPVPEEVQGKILDAAIRAPSGGNTQNWRFLLVDDPAVKAALGPLYRESLGELWETVYKEMVDGARADPDKPAHAQTLKVVKSAQWLAENFERVPLFMFGFAQHDPSGGSIYPAVWNAMLAARAEGVGSSLTSVLGYFRGEQTYEVLGVPADEGWVMACCVSFGYPTGRWGVAARRPVHEVAFRNAWGTPVGFEIPEPLWSPE
ncbi:MAG: nitroreductase family protein [Streptosporangiaceae bacterium]